MKGTNKGLCLSIVSLIALVLSGIGGQAKAQEEIPRRQKQLERRSASESKVPEASLPSSPEELTWWNAIRDAGEAVRLSRGEKKERKKFIELIQEGVDKSYRPPIADRKPLVLSQAEPRYSESARSQRISGAITLQAEMLPDGTVGQVELLSRLGSGLDESAVAAARKAVFLPAIRDRKFVTSIISMEMSFNVY